MKGLPQRDYFQAVNPLLQPGAQVLQYVPRWEFDALKRDVEELKTLLIAAKKFDETTGQPECEVEDKVALIKKVASLVGISMEDVFGTKTA